MNLRQSLLLLLLWIPFLGFAQSGVQAKEDSGPCMAKVKFDGKWILIDEAGMTLDAKAEAKHKQYIQWRDSLLRNLDLGYGLVPMQESRGGITKLGFQNAEGEWVIQPRYDRRKDKPLPVFKDGAITLYRDGRTYWVDTLGTEIFSTEYDAGSGFWFSRGQAVIYGKDSLQGLIDKKGKVKLPPRYRSVSAYAEGFAAVQLTGEEYGYQSYAFVNTAGEIAFGQTFELCTSFHEGFAVVEDEKGNPDFIDLKGNLMGLKKVDYIDNFYGGRALVMRDKRGKNKGLHFEMENCKINFITPEGKRISKKHFEDAGFFSCGLAKVKWKGKYGFINRDGEMVIPAKYEDARGFVNW